ncbi:sulfite exporter TauE/SafE family protein [Pyramidobacter sp.]|uniref:sulfite exporter TauE/SafE family protein n=1 Tax=Pyramidobacter sp. TaxID=1943581 RepID=UPI0025D1D33E|nr:sulfite exporter TauE/SafE family protein [Pyramidobacter sp.]MCI7402819.1 sulfite exporter TauE/SafE family protein [Pyramidobacter sp.]MDY3212101.1 sulfite exporter TauE/SafE family protein [Pyramidobacter sp.]
MDGAHLLAAAGVVFFGGAVQGVAGFGMGMISVPALLRFLPPAAVTPLSLIVATFMNSFFLWNLRRSIRLQLILPILAGAALGVMPGIWALKTVPEGTFKTAAGLFIALAGALLWLGWKCPVEKRPLQLGVGFACGVLNGALAVSGPPIAIFLTAGSVGKDVFRASISAFFLMLNLFTLIGLAQQRLLAPSLLEEALLLVPAVLAGALTGLKLAQRVSEKLFRVFVMTMIVVSGLSLLV